MAQFRVFIGAPSIIDLKRDTGPYTWKTIEPPSAEVSQVLVYPPATLEAATRRISLLYQNIIFDESGEEAFDQEHVYGEGADLSQKANQTTMISWPPTAANTTSAPSFLRISQSQPQSQPVGTYETQETTSLSYSDASSIARFPHFQISLHKVSSLSSLYSCNVARGMKVNVLLAALEVEDPDAVRIKKGPDAGKEISVLKMILGDEGGSICKLTAWRDVADAWGALGVKRGDIIYLENLTPTCEPGSSITLTASPYNKPTVEICFRTMPYTHEDNRLRPDLRLAQSDAAVKKVAALAHWFEQMAGLVVL
ncbi:hypothetical protein K503DRAFT_800650 [Rhizopogon vinicolor AM-OR11-026]|uniref:Shieldin complex subunit 2 first OB fold domain-containing protein n=1 Tax=Rhizopogon vinicolor AM-OR11-026 TaxID=1314800 RepID=A0A1B7N044_9AGAM|nr:hypothetical protein K503DRAFT_800650 [Rhizopogon vinicolor AM-OR11-026]